MDVWSVVTSAAVGALISSVINVLGQQRERAARRRELLFRSAMDLSQKRQELFVSEALRTRRELLIPDLLFNVAEYFAHLQHLFDKGELPASLHDKHKRSLDDFAAKQEAPRRPSE